MTAKLNLDQFAGFTPGPWDTAGLVPQFHIVGGNPQRLIADASCGRDAPKDDYANARLIAAAPALLAECLKQREEIERLRWALEKLTHVFSDLPASRNYGELVQQARAALAASGDA